MQIKKPINFKRSTFGITGYAVVKAFRPLTILIFKGGNKMSELKKVLGYKIGDFETDRGEKVHFTHCYVAYPKEGVTGLAVDIFKCATDDVLNDCKIGDYVRAYFNENKKVVLFVSEEPTEQDLLEFGEAVSVDKLTEEA